MNMKYYNNVLELIGKTPLVKLNKLTIFSFDFFRKIF